MFLAILSYFYINHLSSAFHEYGVASADSSIRRQFGLTFAFIIYLTCKNFIKYLNPKIVFTAIYTQLFFSIINIYILSFYNFVASIFLRIIKIDFVTYTGFRGASASNS